MEEYEVWTPVGEDCSYLVRTFGTQANAKTFPEYLSEQHAKAQQANPLFKIKGEDILKLNGAPYTPVDSFAAIMVAEKQESEEHKLMLDRLYSLTQGKEPYSHPRWNEET